MTHVDSDDRHNDTRPGSEALCNKTPQTQNAVGTLWAQVRWHKCVCVHLCALCGSSCCWLHVVQLHVEEEEDEAVQSRTQTITQTSDTCDHPLGHT